MTKFNLYSKFKLKIEKSPDETKDISLSVASSSLLRSTKCMKIKTKTYFNFMKYTQLKVVKQFFVTIKAQLKSHLYVGYDSSCRCLVLTTSDLVVGGRYNMYGKLFKDKYLYLECFKVEEINYKELLYQLL